MRQRLMELAQRFISAEPNVVRQELWCHECEGYVRFDVDLSLNGNHVLECPNCGHEHYRVVKDGRITDIRWASRNGPTIQSTFVIWRTDATTFTTTSSSQFLAASWLSSSTTS